MSAVSMIDFARTELVEDTDMFYYDMEKGKAMTPYEVYIGDFLLHKEPVYELCLIEKLDCLDALLKLGLNANNLETALLCSICEENGGKALQFEFDRYYQYSFFSDGALRELYEIFGSDDELRLERVFENHEKCKVDTYEVKLSRGKQVVQLRVVNFTCMYSENNYVVDIFVDK